MDAYLLSFNPEANVADQWDFGLLRDVLEDSGFTIYGGNTIKSGTERAVIVIPARHNAEHIDAINKWLSHIEHVVLFLLGDEEAEFPVEKIVHPSIHIWAQNPHMGKHDAYNKLGTGYPAHMRSVLPKTLEKKKDIMFAGQVTHPRRRELIDVLVDMSMGNSGIRIVKTGGFTQGETPAEYFKHLSETKIAPAPSGAIIPDSFRLFEALECMAIPVADQKTPDGTVLHNYWDWLFGEDTPFPKVTEWDRLFGLRDELLADWPRNMHQQTAWWLMYKRNIKNKILEQLGIKLGCNCGEITVIIPTSVLPSHPSTEIIEQTIRDVRVHLPDVEIILQIDGLRPEQVDRKEAYDEYKTQVLWKCLHEWKNVLPVVFDELYHQSGMLKKTLELVKTPLLLYVEGDAPLTPDRKIDWFKCINLIMDGEATTIRFHHENVIPKEHEGLMIGGPKDGFIKTYQWSQRPHLSTVQYYSDVVLPSLPERSFIEDTMHGVVANDWYDKGMLGWFKHRLWIYHPNKNIQRSYTTDGRQGEKKFTSDDEVGL